MAYMDQTKKAKIAPVVKKILVKYNLKGSLSVRSHMTLCLKVKQGPIDFIKNFNDTVSQQPGYGGRVAANDLDVNPYHYQDHFTGKAKAALTELFDAMNDGNHDRSDIQTDYFDVGWYIDLNIGSWNAPYALVK